MFRTQSLVLAYLAATSLTTHADLPAYKEANPRRHHYSARASEIDPRARPHPEIDFVFEKNGKPDDVQQAAVDTRVPPRGRLVIWMMRSNEELFSRLTGYGFHAIEVHYANGWFNKFGKEPPPADKMRLGNIRLEAATGEDFSDLVVIPKPDGMAERAFQFVRWLSRTHPTGQWEAFLSADRKGLDWDRVIIAGSSHGATTSARFALHQKVDRVVMFCGPRDQHETWQGLPSATPKERFFGFSHVLDTGWTGNHYPRSWELLGLQQFGPIVNVDQTPFPYNYSRRLITDADVKGDEKRAHSIVTPSRSAIKDESGKFIHEDVWRYLFTSDIQR